MLNFKEELNVFNLKKKDVMKYEINTVATGLRRITHFSEGLTSFIAGSYVLSLALTNRNVALRVALGITGGYLILRSGSKFNAGSFDDEVVVEKRLAKPKI